MRGRRALVRAEAFAGASRQALRRDCAFQPICPTKAAGTVLS